MGYSIRWEKDKDEMLSRSEIEKVEKIIKFIFPEYYKKCLVKHHGARPVDKLFEVKGEEIVQERVFGDFFGFKDNDPCSVLEMYLSETDTISGVLPKDVVPFADDPGGNYICFDYHDNNKEPKIVFLDLDNQVSLEIVNGDWDDYEINIDDYESEEKAVEFLQRKSLEYVADSFEDFLNMLYSDENN